MSDQAPETAQIAARIISPACDDLDHIDCDEKMCGCSCHEGHPCGHEATVRGCGGCDPSPGPCWRSECRTACYYPQACSERPATCPLCSKPAHDYRCGVTP